MQSNPILTAFKIAAFAILAFLVWITFWQGLRQEESMRELQKRVGTLQGQLSVAEEKSRALNDTLREMNGRLGALTDLLASGAVAPGRPADGAGGNPAPRRPRTPIGKVDLSGATCPAYFSDEARELWGRWDNFLKPDPDAKAYPSLTETGTDPNGRLRMWYGGTPSDINAVTSSDGRVSTQIEEYALRMITARHVKKPSDYDRELAIRVERSPDYKEWVVWLRPDVQWHVPQVDLGKYPHLRGRHLLTAHDVKFTLDLILNPDVNAAHTRSYYSECEGIEVIDEFCYVMRWRKPQYNAISFTVSMQPIPRFVFAYDETGEAYDEGQLGLAFNDHWFYRAKAFIGCGPYFVAEYDPNSHVLLRRFDDFYGQRPAVKEIYWQIFPERKLSIQKLESGEHDLGNLTAKVWEKKVVKERGKNPFSDGRMGEDWIWRTGYSFIGWKNTHPIFADPLVRTAMTMACDRFRIRDVLELGKAEITTGPQHVQSPFTPPDLEPLPFDLEKAKALLAEIGWEDRDEDGLLEKEIDGVVTPFTFKAMVPNNELFRPIFEIFKEDLAKIGVRMDLEFLYWKQFKERLDSRTFACTALLWQGDGWESDLYQIWHSSQIDEVPSSNFIEFSDPKADELIVKLRETFEFDDRVRMQRELHRRIAELQPYTFLMTYKMPMFHWKDRIGNVGDAIRFTTRPKVRYYPLKMLTQP